MSSKVTAAEVKQFSEDSGMGLLQSRRVLEYHAIREDIGSIGSGGEYSEPDYIKSVLLRLLRFAAPDDCTGADCSCHNKTD